MVYEYPEYLTNKVIITKYDSFLFIPGIMYSKKEVISKVPWESHTKPI